MSTSVIFKTPLECWVECGDCSFWDDGNTMHILIGTGPLSSALHVSPHPHNNLGVEFCHHYFKHETTVPCSKGRKQPRHNLKSDLFKDKTQGLHPKDTFLPWPQVPLPTLSCNQSFLYPWWGCQGDEDGSHFLNFSFLCLQNPGHCFARDCLVSTCSVNNVFEPLKGKDPVIFIFFVSLLLPSFMLEIEYP